MQKRRVPTSVWVAWSVAALIITVLAVAVARFLISDKPGHSHTDAFFRNGTIPEGNLLSRNLVTAWQLDAVSLGLIIVAAALYLTGVALRGSDPDVVPWPLARTLSFLAGLGVCAFATNGSIAVYDQVLFTGHMLGHLALVMIAPALLMCGNPVLLAVEASRDPRRLLSITHSRVISLLTAPPVALAMYSVVIVGSHLTGLMDTIMRNEWAGQVEHLVYVGSGCLFFGLVVGTHPIRWTLTVPVRWVMLAVAMAVDTFTGVVLLMQTTPVAMLPAPGVKVNPLSDTHTGGAIMWVGGDGIMAAIMVVLAIGWIRGDGASTGGWLEQARQTAFTDRVGSPAGRATDGVSEGTADLDEDDSQRTAYNTWLASIADKDH